MAQMVPVVMLLMLSMMMNASWAFSSSSDGFRVDLTHSHHQRKLTPSQLHRLAIQQTKRRMAALMAKRTSSSNSTTNAVQARVHYGDLMYLMELAIGTPPVTVRMVIDTESDFTWTPCKPCKQCPAQPLVFDPSKSSTFSKLHCNTSLCRLLYQTTCTPDCTYFAFYGNAYVGGVLATETLTLKANDGQDALVSGMAFGCNHVSKSTNDYGVLGLSRSPLSLVSQLGVGKFSYCFTPYGDSNTGPIFFGSLANLNESSSMPLPYSSNPDYFIPLKGITVGARLIPIPKDAYEVDEDGSTPLFLDTSSPYGSLMKPLFKPIKEEFIASLKLPTVHPMLTHGELCFSLPSISSVKLPKLIFHFEGADLELPVDNYMIHDPSTGFLCFTMIENPYSSSFGSFQQQNMHVVYDLVQAKASISPAQCDRL